MSEDTMIEYGILTATLEAFDGTPEQFKKWALTPIESWDMEKRFSYLTLDSMLGQAQVDKIQGAVKSISPRYDGYMQATGVVIADPKTLELLKQMEGGGLLTHAQAEQIRGMARTISKPADDWGGSLSDDELAQAVQMIARRKLMANLEAEYQKARQAVERSMDSIPTTVTITMA